MDFDRIKKGAMRRLFGTDLIAPGWYLKTQGRLFLSRKIKVGFGPITTGEDTLAERKWRIDPIIDRINRRGSRYVAGFFTKPKEMEQFDILIIVKKINLEWIDWIEKLREQHLIYDIVDNPNDEERYRFYFRDFPQFLKRVDAFILSSPVHAPWVKKIGKRGVLIEHPILNPPFQREGRNEGEIRILAQGYSENLQNLAPLEKYLPALSNRVGKKIRLYYHSEITKDESEFVGYVKWSVENCFQMMEWADIGITIKDLHKPHQYTKPSTKVIAYMAAALPVICKPSAADRLVIENGVTGFFAYRGEDWIRWIEYLALNQKIRLQVGRAAQKSVIARYSLDHILEKYLAILDSLR